MSTRCVGAVALLLIATGGAANAADLPIKAPPIIPAVSDPWNGFYLGINGGGGLGRNHTYDQTALVPGDPLTVFGIADFKHAPFGGVFGAQAGWNWHFAPTW